MKKTFRFDDVCINSNMNNVNEITDYLLKRFNGCDIIWAVSPFVNDSCGERVFPSIYNAYSDHREFYKVDKCGLPKLRKDVIIATHGLIHVDHRLLNKEAQEVSILTSASLLKSNMFVPPFNKYNQDTVDICIKAGIELIKFESVWMSMEYNKYKEHHQYWYLHPLEWNINSIKQWFK